MDSWTVLMVGHRVDFVQVGFIQEDLTLGDSVPEKAKKFPNLADAIEAATAVQGHDPDICQIRFVRSDFGAQTGCNNVSK